MTRLGKQIRGVLLDPQAVLFKFATRMNWGGLAKRLTRNPISFSQKLRHKMVQDRNPQLVIFADKVQAKDYIASRIGSEYVPKTLMVAEDASHLQLRDLPEECAIKV